MSPFVVTPWLWQANIACALNLLGDAIVGREMKLMENLLCCGRRFTSRVN